MDVSLVPKSRKSAPHPPTEEVVTEGQRQLRTLLDKQLKKDVTVQQQLSQKRTFTGASTHDPTINKLSGLVNVQHFSDIQDTDSYIAELRQCGLSEEEIDIKLSHDSALPGAEKRPRLGIDPRIHEERMVEIERKIEERNKAKLNKHDEFYGKKSLTRHEMELEASLLRESSKNTQRISTILTKVGSSRGITHPDDPMNHLEEILHEVTKSSNRDKKGGHGNSAQLSHYTNIEEDGKRAQELKKSANVTEKECASHGVVKSESEREITLHKCNIAGECEGMKDNIRNAAANKSKATESRTEVEELNEKVTYIPEFDIQASRLSDEDIKKIPRFENYTPGIPSKTLYLKNLSRTVTPADLVAMFGRYEEDTDQKIVYRLMSGRMKGQAFVEFKDVDTATRALTYVNGYMLKGKPVIIQYSKK